MNFGALATDYDGTLAHDGVVLQGTVDALRQARQAGLRLVMVTGRQLSDLLTVFAQPGLFDWIVAENGAVLYEPAAAAVRVLGSAPPPALLDRLARNRIPISTGRSILAAAAAYEPQLLECIRELGLDWHLIVNKGSVMALPAGVTKATGLAAALAALRIPPQRVIGVGDAENDEAFLRICGLAVAVGNALPSVQAVADIVTRGPDGAGITELIGRLVAGDLSHEAPRRG